MELSFFGQDYRRTSLGPRFGGVTVLCCLVVALTPAGEAESQLQGRVVRVGLFAGGNPIVREGEPTFAEVELRFNGTKPFEGALRLEQRDRDGDVAVSRTDVALTPNGDPRSYFVYFVPHDLGIGDTIRVQVVDADGGAVDVQDGPTTAPQIVSPPVGALSPDELLIVDLSKLGQVALLDSGRSLGLADSLNRRTVRPLSPSDLPTNWMGLAIVDAIVWDDANPGEANDRQLAALIEWVRHGGRLLVTSGSNWKSVANSRLARVLPVTITGVDSVTEALEFENIVGKELFGSLKLDRKYLKNPITRCRMIPQPDAIRVPRDIPNEQIAFRRILDRGLVTFVGASLNQLLPPFKREVLSPETIVEDDYSKVCEAVVGQSFLLLPPNREVDNTGFVQSLFGQVRKSIGFETVSAAFLVFAILFAIIYTLTATAGSYWFLKRRSLEHHCWTAFAVFGIVGSAIGTGMVWTLRGFTTKLWQTTIVDAHAGRDYGYGTCLFGVKTPDHTRLNLQLPVGLGMMDQLGMLQIMPEEQAFDAMESRFVASESYGFLRSGTELTDVPYRATLKEVYSRGWHGPLGGTLDAKLVFRKIDEDGQSAPDLAEESFIRNSLGVDLKECFLIETEEDGTDRFASRSLYIRCHYLRTLAAEGTDSELDADELRQLFYFEPRNSSRPNDPPKRKPLPNLAISRWISRWEREIARPISNRFGIVVDDVPTEKLTSEDYHYALLLLSAFDFITDDPGAPIPVRFSRTHGRSLGCMHELTAGTAILIGYSEEPSPAVLHVDRTALRSTKSHTMYRFVIPVERR